MKQSASSQDRTIVFSSFPRRIPDNAESPVRDEMAGCGPYEEEPSMDSSHVSALHLKHAGLERQIHEELNRPMPDIVVVQTLKKRKLRLKEVIAASVN
jgi:hypothetical protein